MLTDIDAETGERITPCIGCGSPARPGFTDRCERCHDALLPPELVGSVDL